MKLTKAQIDTLFDESANAPENRPEAFLIALYRDVYPKFDEMETVPFAVTHSDTSKYICSLFLQMPKQLGVMNGGLWLNHGFTVDDTMKPWTAKQA